MKLKILIPIVLIALILNGCAVISDKRVAAACQVADGATTYYALEHSATELNPILSGMPPALILVLKLAFAYWIFTTLSDYVNASDDEKVASGAITLLGCIPAASNLRVIKGL